MEGLADNLFPHNGNESNDGQHSLGPKDHKNRLIAYVFARLKGELEGHEKRAFTGMMDVIMRWTGSGPHGAYRHEDTEHMYTRMLDALTVVARAFEAAG